MGVQSRTSLGGKKVFFISYCRNKKKLIKDNPSDPFGFTASSDASPGAEWINDCCVLNLDEKPTNTNFGMHEFFSPRDE